MPLACLAWYDLAETRDATDRLWRGIAQALAASGVHQIPDKLDRRADYASQWQTRELLLGQACGYDVYCANEHKLQVVGVPRYVMPGCEGKRYRSFVIVRDDASYTSIEDLRGARCVINSPRSHSGMNVLQALVAPLAVGGRFFGSVQVSGAHERSLELIRLGHADVAAIDCITYGLLMRHRPQALTPTRIVQHTDALTAPPYVTSTSTSADMIAILFGAIASGIAELTGADRSDLGLDGVESVTLDDYQGIGELADRAHEERYTELRHSSGQVSPDGSS